MFFRQITDEKLAQYAYLIGCQRSGEALIIDPERDIDRYQELAEQEGLRIVAAADTHIHADYLSGLREFAERGVRVYMSDEGDENWKYEWAKEGNYDAVFLRDGDAFYIGSIEIQAIHSPGHTPEHLSYLVTDHGGGADRPMGIASGDFVFVGDVGRPDLLESAAGIPGMQDPSARTLYRSVRRFLDMPDFLQLWPGHGAGSACGKALGAVPHSTVGYEKLFNAAVDAARIGEDEFVDSILAGQPEPPLYFARMKRLNKEGAPVLGDLPRPRQLLEEEVPHLLSLDDAVIIDTRSGSARFMAEHLPGSLYAPLDKTFNTVVGSYVTDPARPIYLVIEEECVEEAVRDLIRIGYDRIAGYLTPQALARYFERGGEAACIRTAGFDVVEQLRKSSDGHVLDVRSASEFDASAIPGAQNVAHTRLADRIDEIPHDRTLYVHCRHGARAAVAAAYLASEGYSVVHVAEPFAHWMARHESRPSETVL